MIVMCKSIDSEGVIMKGKIFINQSRTRHRDRCTTSNREQQWHGSRCDSMDGLALTRLGRGITRERPTRLTFQLMHGFGVLVHQLCRDLLVMAEVLHACFGRNHKSGRYGQLHPGHLTEVTTLVTEQLLVLGRAFVKVIHMLGNL